jgi:hypothetical protein
MDTCERAPSGSLFPARGSWTTSKQTCRSCGKTIKYNKLGLWVHAKASEAIT